MGSSEKNGTKIFLLKEYFSTFLDNHFEKSNEFSRFHFFQSTDTDLVFDDLTDENVHVPFKNVRSTYKRSVSDENERDIDVEDLMNIDDNGEHWLWGPVKRIRRSIDKLLGTDNPSGVDETTESQSAKKPLPKHRKKVLPSDDKRRNKKLLKTGGKLKTIGNRKMVMRPKRQEYDDDLDDDDEDDDDEILEPDSSGGSDLPELYPEVSEKEDRLCKYRLFFNQYTQQYSSIIYVKYCVNDTVRLSIIHNLHNLIIYCACIDSLTLTYSFNKLFTISQQHSSCADVTHTINSAHGRQ